MKRPLQALRTALLSRPRLRVPDRSSDVESATLPAWFIPGVLDWWQHRRTDIAHTLRYGEELIRCARAAASTEMDG